MNYREFLHEACTDTDMDNKEDVTMLIQFLLREAVNNHDSGMEYEEKLKELMSAKEFEIFSKESAVRLLERDLNSMPDCEFKDFALKNFDILIDDSLSFTEAHEAIKERERHE